MQSHMVYGVSLKNGLSFSEPKYGNVIFRSCYGGDFLHIKRCAISLKINWYHRMVFQLGWVISVWKCILSWIVEWTLTHPVFRVYVCKYMSTIFHSIWIHISWRKVSIYSFGEQIDCIKKPDFQWNLRKKTTFIGVIADLGTYHFILPAAESCFITLIQSKQFAMLCCHIVVLSKLR